LGPTSGQTDQRERGADLLYRLTTRILPVGDHRSQGCPSGAFPIHQLEHQPRSTGEGQEITIEAFITNITTEPAEYNAVLWLNSQVQANASVTIGRLSTESVVFTTQLEEGNYSVRIDKLLGELNVGAAGSSPIPSPTPIPAQEGTPAPTPLPGATLPPAATPEPGAFDSIPVGGITAVLVAGIVVGALALLAVGVAISKS